MAAETYYYARVSSTSQSLARQIEAFKKEGADDRHIITEVESGKSMERPHYQNLKEMLLRNGDTLVIMSLDRLGRNKEAIKNELEYFKNNHIRVRILDLPTTNIKVEKGQELILDMVNNILIEVLAYMAEQERLTIRKRQAEGIKIAKAQGKYKGRQPKPIDEALFKELYKQYMTRKITKTEMASQLGISRPTLDEHIKKYSKDLQ